MSSTIYGSILYLFSSATNHHIPQNSRQGGKSAYDSMVDLHFPAEAWLNLACHTLTSYTCYLLVAGSGSALFDQYGVVQIILVDGW